MQQRLLRSDFGKLAEDFLERLLSMSEEDRRKQLQRCPALWFSSFLATPFFLSFFFFWCLCISQCLPLSSLSEALGCFDEEEEQEGGAGAPSLESLIPKIEEL